MQSAQPVFTEDTMQRYPTSNPQSSEQSLAGRFVSLLIPILAIGAGWLAGVVGQAVPGLALDENQMVAFMVAAATAVITSGWKWLQGWQQHELLVAEGKAQARRVRGAGSPSPT